MEFYNYGGNFHSNIDHAVLRSVNQAERWKTAKANLDEKQLEKLNRMFELKTMLEKAGVKYDLMSRELPTVSQEKAEDKHAFEQPKVMDYPYYNSNNQDRWNYAKQNMDDKAFSALEEMFNLLDELKSSGVEYKVTPANAETAALPLLKKGEKDPSQIQLL